MEILVAAINIIWLWICLAPALLIITVFLIRLGLRSTSNQNLSKPTTHKHNWRECSTYEDKTEILDSYFAKYHFKYECTDCDEEIDEFTVGLI